MVKRQDYWWATALIFLGIGFGGDAAKIWNVGVFLEAWWVLFVIVPCVINMVEVGISRGNVIGLGLGGALFFSQWFPAFRNFMVAYTFLVLGFTLLFIPSHKDYD